MKKLRKLFLMSAALILLILLIAANKSINYLANNVNKSSTVVNTGNIAPYFLIGALDNCVDSGFGSSYDSMKFNLWHSYVHIIRNYSQNKFFSKGWDWWNQDLTTAIDQVEAPVSNYSSLIQSTLSKNQTRNMRTLMQRPKVDLLCFGQRSDYQCDSVPDSDPLWFYGFQSPGHTGSDTPDSSQSVRYCNSTIHSAGYVVSRLKANNEQCNVYPPYGLRVEGDKMYDWYIRPRIRVDSAFVNNPANWYLPVCRIDVKNTKGNVFKTIEIKARNFKLNQFTIYKGNYLDEFYFKPIWDDDYTQEIKRDTSVNKSNAFNPDSSGWEFKSRGNETSDVNCVKVDIQVYWYGYCDMWIDYVRVDNDIADKLFKGYYEDPTHPERQWLQNEAQFANYNSSPLKFYIEEYEFNHLPAMAYVSRKLKQYSGNNNFSLMTVWQYNQLNLHINGGSDNLNHIDKNKFVRFVVDSVGLSQVMITPYNIVAKNSNLSSKVPSTLPMADYDPYSGRLADSVLPEVYEQWLQWQLDDDDPDLFTQRNGLFGYFLKNALDVSKARNIPVINMPQAHVWNDAGERLREATNEELEILSTIPVTFNSKGNIYFWWGAWGRIGSDSWGRGLVDINPIGFYRPRYLNVYGQEKWNKVKQINEKLTRWSPYLMDFTINDTRSFAYYKPIEREDLHSNTYFNRFITYKPGTVPPGCIFDSALVSNPVGYIYDCADETYLQIGLFNKLEQGNKYFMVINRRCSPYKDSTSSNNRGGKRKVHALIDYNSQELQQAVNWKIIDLYDNSYVTQFSRLEYPYPKADLGVLMPGESKLYCMIPVTQSGGELIADDTISGESFTLLDTLYTNGHNLTIGNNTTIRFTDSSKIIVNGGSLTIGDAGFQGTPNINFVNETGSTGWSGIEASNANIYIYKANFLGIRNDSSYALNLIDCRIIDIRNSTFTSNDTYKGAISVNYINVNYSPNIYIYNNTFNASTSVKPQLSMLSYAGVTIPAIIEDNDFNNGSNAIMLSDITGGAVKSNTFTNSVKPIIALASSLDIYGNTITGSTTGLEALSGTELKMNRSQEYFLGGYNNITSSEKNISAEGSYFLLNRGENVFDLTNTQNIYHLFGYFPLNPSISTEATLNCFKNNGTVTDPVNTVTWGYNGQSVVYNFIPYLSGCDPEGSGDNFISDLGNGIYDTIAVMQGQGGSNPDKQIILSPAGSAYDSICINIRKRNYLQSKTRAEWLINTFPDSIYSLNSVS